MTNTALKAARAGIVHTSPSSTAARNALGECAAFVSELDAHLPQSIGERARACLFYALGTGLLCLTEPYGKIAETGIMSLEGTAAQGVVATALSSGKRLSPAAAAFCNAVMLHGRCQEDTYASTHLGIAVIPPVLALVEAGLAAGSSIIPSIVAGYEVGGALARMFNKDTSSFGLRASPLYGTIAAATASSKAMRLSVEQTASAIAHAASFTGGTLQAIADGTDEWRYQMGVAVRRGMEAAALSKAGAVGSGSALNGQQGFAQVYARKDLQTPLNLETQWALPEVAFKPYPICARNQTPAILATHISARVPSHEIASVHLRISDHLLNGMLDRHPRSRASALMSTYFCVALALSRGTINLEMLSDVDNAEIKALVDRIKIKPDASVAYPDIFAEVETTSGERLTFQHNGTMAEFAYSGPALLALLKQTAQVDGLNPSLLDQLYRHTYSSEPTSIELILEVFHQARTQRV